MAKQPKSILSLRLRLLRVASGMKQGEIAELLGVGRSAYTYYELSRSKPDYDSLIKLAKLFHVSIDYLVGLSNFPEIATRPQVSADVPDERLILESNVAQLERDERYYLALFRQLSPDAQADILEQLQKKVERNA